MAIVQNPIIGASRKSAGGMVFSRSLDQNIIRAKPITYNDKNSIAQQSVRSRMRNVTGLAKADSKKALDALYPTRPYKQTKFSRLIQQLMVAVKVVDGAVVTNFTPLLTLGNGSIANHATSASYIFDGYDIVIEQTNSYPNIASNPNFRLFAFVFNITKNQGVSSTSEDAMIASNEFIIAVPPNWVALDDYAVYLGYTDVISGNSTLAYSIEKTT